MTEDIVNQEAFKVIKNDFLKILNHDTNSISVAFGMPAIDESNFKGTDKFLNEVLQEHINKLSKATEVILNRAETFNEFLQLYTLFLLARECNQAKVSVMGLPFGAGTFGEGKLDERTLARLDEILGDLFKKMRGGKDV